MSPSTWLSFQDVGRCITQLDGNLSYEHSNRNSPLLRPANSPIYPAPIRSKADYERASAVLDKLAIRDESTLDAGESYYFETLTL